MSATTLKASTDTRLRRALVIDGIVSGVVGVPLTAAAGPLTDLLGLPTPLLRFAGIILLLWATALIYIATRAIVHRRAAWSIVGINLLWVVASVVLLVSGWVDPTALGVIFVMGQALVVVAFAELQYLGLRRSDR